MSLKRSLKVLSKSKHALVRKLNGGSLGASYGKKSASQIAKVIRAADGISQDINLFK